MTIDKKSFCYVPFHELYVEEGVYGNKGTQRVRNCCVQTESYETDNIFTQDPVSISKIPVLQKIRSEFLQGKKPKECVRCWQFENKGLESFRQMFNLAYTEKKIPMPTTDVFDIKTIDLRLSNKCNLSCKMCNAHDSNQIAKLQWNAYKQGAWEPIDISIEDFKNKLDPANYTDRKNFIRTSENNLVDDVVKFIKTNVKGKCRIKIAGGEPFIMPEVEELFEKCIAEKLQDKLYFFIITNATTVKQSMVEKIQQFDHWVGLSVDGTGELLEYQRSGAKWSVIDNNIDELSSKLTTHLIPCWSHLNLFSLPDFLNWVGTKSNVTGVFCSEVTWPTFLNWEVIPLHYRKPLIERLKNCKIPNNIRDVEKQSYQNLIANIETQNRKLTSHEKKEFKNAVTLWDFQNPIPYIDRYPWAKELLDQ